MTISSRLASGPKGSETGSDLVCCALMAVPLSSAWSSRTAWSRRVARRPALRQAGYQVIAGLQTAVQLLDHLGISMIGDPGLDPHRLKRFVRKELPHDLSVVFRSVTLAGFSRSRSGGRRSPCFCALQSRPRAFRNTVFLIEDADLFRRHVGFVAQCAVGDLDCVGGRCHRNADIGGHAGEELQLWIGEINNRVIR